MHVVAVASAFPVTCLTSGRVLVNISTERRRQIIGVLVRVSIAGEHYRNSKCTANKTTVNRLIKHLFIGNNKLHKSYLSTEVHVYELCCHSQSDTTYCVQSKLLAKRFFSIIAEITSVLIV